METKHPVMLVGNAGCGKTVLIGEKLSSLNENFAVANVPFNFYTSSEMFQKILEKPLEKKAGRNYGPPGNKTLIYFIDDMNMPEVEKKEKPLEKSFLTNVKFLTQNICLSGGSIRYGATTHTYSTTLRLLSLV